MTKPSSNGDFYKSARRENGGSAWESNPPETVLAPHTEFEVREPHQRAVHFPIKDACRISKPGANKQNTIE